MASPPILSHPPGAFAAATAWAGYGRNSNGQPTRAGHVQDIADRLVEGATILRFSGTPYRQPGDVHGAPLDATSHLNGTTGRRRLRAGVAARR